LKLPFRIIPLFILIISSPVFAYAENAAEEVCFRDACVNSEVADTAAKRAQGLMYRKELAENKGMLFVFDEEVLPGFWMQNMEFPLDIIWISKDKRIIGINTNALPCRDFCESIVPPDKIKYALEVKAGFAEKNQVKTGDKADFGGR